MGLLELFKDEEVDDSKQYISLIEKSIHKLDETIHEIIEYSRNNRVEITVEPIDFALIANDVLESLSFMDQAKNMDIQVQVDQPVPFYSDLSRLRVIFHNLISNGIKYCDLNKPERHLHISVTSNARKAIIKIKDNGIGIDEDDLEKVFSMFYRATQQASGSGLGLYILKEAVMKLNGVVNASGQLGKGVTFIIQVPNLQQ
jgi:signal transduction histidine kinase